MPPRAAREYRSRICKQGVRVPRAGSKRPAADVLLRKCCARSWLVGCRSAMRQLIRLPASWSTTPASFGLSDTCCKIAPGYTTLRQRSGCCGGGESLGRDAENATSAGMPPAGVRGDRIEGSVRGAAPAPPVTVCYPEDDSDVARIVDRQPRASRALGAFWGGRAAIGAGSGPGAECRASRNA